MQNMYNKKKSFSLTQIITNYNKLVTVRKSYIIDFIFYGITFSLLVEYVKENQF